MRRTLLLPTLFLSASTVCALSVNILTVPSECSYDDGTATAYPNGGVPPYTYLWSTGGDTQTITGLAPGNYSVTVMDSEGTIASNNATVGVGGLWLNNSISSTPACMGKNGSVGVNMDALGGFAPYTFTPPPTSINGNWAVFSGYGPFQPFSIDIQDVNGCAVTASGLVPSDPGPVIGEPVVYPACNGAANGSAVVEFGLVFNLGLGNKATYTLVGPGGLVSSQLIWIMSGFTFPTTFTGLQPGAYTVTLEVNGFCGTSSHSVDFTIPDIGPDCGALQGTVWADSDGDCTIDVDEVTLPYRVLTIEPGTHYVITDANGAHETPLVYGEYTLEQEASDLLQTCPLVSPIPFTIDAIAPNPVVNIADSSMIAYDLETNCSVTTMQPGFTSSVWMTVHNRSMYLSDALTLSLTYDPVLIFQSASTPPTNSGPGYLEWELPTLPGFAYAPQIHVVFALPSDPQLIGTTVQTTATVVSGISEDDIANNTCASITTVVGSYDPNDKLGATSSGLSAVEYFLDQDEWIDYTIRFQNTGTAPAETVVIRDTIDADLHIPSLEILGASHAFTPSFGQGRELVFTFNGINLPDSATDFAGSQGFVSYRIKPRSDVQVGMVLKNNAAIYFDFNPPIITNTVTQTTDFSTAVDRPSIGPGRELSAIPNPASETVSVLLPEGTDVALTVFSIDGRLIDLPMERKAELIQLDVRSLAAGSYIVRTGTGNARFIKR